MVTNGNHGNLQFTAERKREFLKLYPEWGSIGATAKQLGFHRQTVFDAFKADPAFRQAYEGLVHERRDDLISRMYRAATGRCKADRDEIGACLRLLQATDHMRDEFESSRFTDRMEHTGENGKEIVLRVVYDNN